MGRNILAVIAGIIAGACTVFLIEMIGHLLLPPPTGIDVTDHASIKAAMPNMSLPSVLAIILGWAAGAFVGGWVAAALARDHKTRCAMIVGALIILSGIATMLMIPHPIWFWIAGILLPIPCALAGARLGLDRNRQALV